MDRSRIENWGRSFAAGLAGAAALTAVHQLARRVTSRAPRMDVLGERALARGADAMGYARPSPTSLSRLALAGDLLANSAYYSLIACGRDPRIWTRALLMGTGAGVGALALPRPLGLGDAPHSDSIANQGMTIAWYLIGALATAATAECLLALRDVPSSESRVLTAR